MKCFICKEDAHKNHRLIKYLIDEYVHADCVKCVLCKRPMSEKYNPYRSNTTLNGVIFWHSGCKLMCNQCGQESGCFTIDLNNNVPIHTNCTKNLCAVCHKSGVGTEGAIIIRSYSEKCNIIMHDGCQPVPIEGISCHHKLRDPNIFWPEWSPNNHQWCTMETRAAIKEFFLVCKRLWNHVPRDIMYLIAQWVATPDGWLLMNGLSITDICTPYRCKDWLECHLCRDPIRWNTGGGCNMRKCIKYSHQCPRCHIFVKHGSDPQKNCTFYRCIEEKCSLCQGKLRYEGTQNDLCGTECLKYHSAACNICGDLIVRAEYINNIEQSSWDTMCTRYRCKHSKCSKCAWTETLH